MYCFGYNDVGQLGDGSTTDSYEPVQVGSASDWIDIKSSEHSACGVRATGDAYCWGDNERGQLGSALAAISSSSPVAIAAPASIKRVVGRNGLLCAITNMDTALCWGENVRTNGGFGRGVSGIEATPVDLDGSYTQIAITSNNYEGPGMGGCGIKSDNKIYCWGAGHHVIQAGGGFQAFTPVAINNDTDWAKVVVTPESSPLVGQGSNLQFGHACALKTGGDLYCWGSNHFGQLGNGTTLDSSVPVQVPIQSPFTQIWIDVSVRQSTTCAIDSLNRMYCWGDNSQNRLGNGNTTSESSPYWIIPGTFFTSVSTGYSESVAVSTTGTLYSWGVPSYSSPNVVTNAGTGIVEARAGASFMCVLSSGTMHCGNVTGPWLQASARTDIAHLLDFGQGSYCYQRMGGEIECASYNGSAWVVATSPVVPAGTWTSLQFQNNFSCGLRPNGTRACFGARYAGSFGDGFDERIPAAVLVP